MNNIKKFENSVKNKEHCISVRVDFDSAQAIHVADLFDIEINGKVYQVNILSIDSVKFVAKYALEMELTVYGSTEIDAEENQNCSAIMKNFTKGEE